METAASNCNPADVDALIHMPHEMPPEGITPSLGALIKKYRAQGDISKTFLAELMEVSRSTVSSWEADKTKPTLDQTLALCQWLRMPLYEIFGLSHNSIPDAHEYTLLSLYRQLSPISQKIVYSTVLNTLTEERDARDRYLRDNYKLLPLIPLEDVEKYAKG